MSNTTTLAAQIRTKPGDRGLVRVIFTREKNKKRLQRMKRQVGVQNAPAPLKNRL